MDAGMQAARYPRAPKSTELMTVEEVDSQLARARVPQKDLETMLPRHATKIYVDLAARQTQDQPRFERRKHESETRADLGELSSTSRKVQKMRTERSYEALDGWEQFAQNTI